MAGQIEIFDTERTKLKEILVLLKLNQSELSNATGFYQSWLSQILSGKSTHISGDRLKKIADVLIERAKDFHKSRKLSDEQIIEIAVFLSRFTTSTGDLIPKKSVRPGDIIRESAINYIERKADKEIADAFSDPPFTLLVSGPPQTGKTSLLAKLEDIAREKRIETLWFDLKQEIPTSFKGDINNLLVVHLFDALQNNWKLKAPSSKDEKITSIINLTNWFKKALYPSRNTPRLFVIDGLERIGMTRVETWLRRFVRELHNERNKSSEASTQVLSIAVGISYGYGEGINTAAMLISSIVSWSTEIKLKWFEKEEVEKLAKQTGTSADVKSLYQLFQGQPYLTSYAIYDEDFFNAVKEWNVKKTEKNSRPIRGAKAYTNHLSAIRRVLFEPLWDRPEENKEVLKSLSKVYKNKDFKIKIEHKKYLVTANLLREDNTPTMSIYELIIEDLYEEILGGA